MRLYQTGGIALIMAALVTMTEASAADVSPASLAFSALIGGSNPANQTLTLSKDNKRQFSWASSDNATWLSVTPTSGLLTRSTQIAVAVNTSGLAPGLYTGRVTININKRSLRVPVSLSITAPPAAPPPPPPQSTSATSPGRPTQRRIWPAIKSMSARPPASMEPRSS
jgi:hypothetical protein